MEEVYRNTVCDSTMKTNDCIVHLSTYAEDGQKSKIWKLVSEHVTTSKEHYKRLKGLCHSNSMLMTEGGLFSIRIQPYL